MPPTAFLMTMTTDGPPAGISPSGRNWVLSVARVEMYVDLVTSALLTKLGGSTLATSAALCVASQRMVATTPRPTFCPVPLLASPQLLSASTPAVGVKPPSHFCTPAVVVR